MAEESKQLIIRAGDPLPLTFKHVSSNSAMPARLDIDIGNPANSSLQPLASKTGMLEAKTYIASKKEKIMIDIVPMASNRYSPNVNDVVLGVVVAKTFDNFTIDINSEFGPANLSTLEF